MRKTVYMCTFASRSSGVCNDHQVISEKEYEVLSIIKD